MRTRAVAVLASGVIAMTSAVVGWAPAGAATTAPSPSASGSPSSSASATACPVNAAAIEKSKSAILEVIVRDAARPAETGPTLLPVLIKTALRGTAKPAAVNVVVSGNRCAEAVVTAAKPQDVLIVIGTVVGTRVLAEATGPSVLTCDDAVRSVKAASDVLCPVVLAAPSTDQPKPWLKIAAPGLAAIIVSVLGLLLLRLRRR